MCASFCAGVDRAGGGEEEPHATWKHPTEGALGLNVRFPDGRVGQRKAGREPDPVYLAEMCRYGSDSEGVAPEHGAGRCRPYSFGDQVGWISSAGFRVTLRLAAATTPRMVAPSRLMATRSSGHRTRSQSSGIVDEPLGEHGIGVRLPGKVGVSQKQAQRLAGAAQP